MVDVPFPIPAQQIILTIAVCVIIGIFFMGALLVHKKRIAKKLEKQGREQPAKDPKDKNEITP